MWWGGFSEFEEIEMIGEIEEVLIPMWWGGFSESHFFGHFFEPNCLNPHVVGRFFRGLSDSDFSI